MYIAETTLKQYKSLKNYSYTTCYTDVPLFQHFSTVMKYK